MILRILLFIVCLLFSHHSWAQFTTPGMIPKGSFTLGDCLESAGGISIQDAGAACGSSSSSIGGTITGGTAGDFLYINPTATLAQLTPAAALSKISSGIFVDPRNYGAVCDGATWSGGRPTQNGSDNDTNGFHAAAVAAQNVGGAVLVPDGCWVSDLNSLPAGSVLVGQGWAPNYGYDYGSGNIFGITLSPGSGYTNGTYALSPSGAGASFSGTVTVSGGQLASYTISNPGYNWVSGTTIPIPAGAGAGTGGSITPVLTASGQPFTKPVMYIIGTPSYGIDLGGTENVALVGFEINGNSNSGAFGSTSCAGSSAGSSGFGGKIWLTDMSFKGCNAGYSVATGNVYVVSQNTDYGANNYGMYGSISDLLSMGDTFVSDSTAGLYLQGGFQRLVGDRIEYQITGLQLSASSEVDITNTQFDHTNRCAINITGGVDVNMTGGAIRGSGLDGSLTVTGTSSGTGGVVRLAVNGNNGTSGLVTGDKANVAGVLGTTEANGTNFTITVVDGSHIELQGTTYVHAYTSGGYAGIYGKDADICLGNGSLAEGFHFDNVGYYSTSYFGASAAPAYILDTTTSYNDFIDLLHGVGQAISSVNNVNYNSYSIAAANWESFGAPAHVNIDMQGTPLFRNDNSQFSINGNSLGIGTSTPNTNAAIDASNVTTALIPPVGSTGQRPTPSVGMLRYNNTTNAFEGYQGASPAWSAFGGVSWPTSGDIVLSAGSGNNPTGLAESDGECVVGSGGVWTAGSCGGTSASTLGTSVTATSPQRSGEAGTGIWTNGSGLIDFASSGVNVAQFSSNIFYWGVNGSTNPILYLDDSTTSVATGVAIKGAATGGTTTITATDSGSNTGLVASAKGTGTAGLNGGTAYLQGNVNGTSTLGTAPNVVVNAPGYGDAIYFNLQQPSYSSIIPWVVQANSGYAIGSGNVPMEYFQNSHGNVVRGGNTTVTLQEDTRIDGSPDTMPSAGTVTTKATLGVVPSTPGSNVTVTNDAGLNIETASLSNVTSGFGLISNAPTGATNNYAAQFVGSITQPSGSYIQGGVTENFPGSGNIVGTTDTQTLTNKSIAGSEINSGTVSASYLPTATTGAFGVVKPDGSTITISGGVISASSSGSGPTFSPPYTVSGGNYYLSADNMYQATLPNFSTFSALAHSAGTMTYTANGNGDYKATSSTSYAFSASSAGTTSIETVFSSVDLTSGGQGLTGIWVYDSTNSLIYALNNVDAGPGSKEMYVETYSYNGTAAPSFTGFPFQGTAPTVGLAHYKLSVSGGTLTAAISVNGGESYVTFYTVSVGTIGSLGIVVQGASANIDSLVIH